MIKKIKKDTRQYKEYEYAIVISSGLRIIRTLFIFSIENPGKEINHITYADIDVIDIRYGPFVHKYNNLLANKEYVF